MKSISIVVPVFYSYTFLSDLLESIEEVRMEHNWDLELILVDDGSKDESYEKIKELAIRYSYIKGVKLSRNFGHQLAVRTGLNFCSKDLIAVIDDDLQDPPSLLPEFIKLIENGYDVVYGVRRKRKENIFKRTAYKGFYIMLKHISNIDIQLDSGDFCVMKRHVVEKMLLFPEQNPFLRGIRSWVGYRQIGFEYERNSRISGNSGYTFKKLMKIALDGIFAHSKIPIKFISFLGGIGVLFAICYSIILLNEYVFFGIKVQGYTSLVLLLLFFSSIILVSIGILGEYIVRILDEVRNRPHVVIEETLNI